MPLMRQLQFALALTSIVPLLASSYLILRYVSPAILAREGVIAILLAVMVLMLAGARMMFRLISNAEKAATGGASVDMGTSLRVIQGRLGPEGRSIRHTVAEATALIGAIPFLALGYVVVRYVLPLQTTWDILLLILSVAFLLFLGIQQIRHLTKRILTVAADAKLVRLEAGIPKQEYGVDEIGELSTDLSGIATELSTRATELQQTKSFLSNLIERLPHPLLAVSSSSTINLVNPAAEELLGYEAGELVDMNISSIFPAKEDVEKLLAENGETVLDTVWRRKDGINLPVSVCSGTLSQEGGLVLLGTDLTRRRRLEEELRHAQKMEAIGLLAGGIAHDFNNLLTIIKGYTYFLKEGLGRDDPRKVDLDNLHMAIDRASGLTYQLLAFSKKQILDPRIINLNSVVCSMDSLFRRLLGENIEISTLLTPDLGNVKADMGQMEQVIINLAINGRDAMPDGGKLIIESTNADLDEEYSRYHPDVPSGPYVMMSVTDTGCGMSREVKKRIFEPFFTTKEVGRGSGLGLSTVYGIVKQHGGHISVYSEEGKGTVFQIYLPRVVEEVEEMDSGQEKEELPRGSETILLVEDDEKLLDIGRRVLQSQGYTVLVARDGKEALDISGWHGGRIDLLVTDVIMPTMGGKELAERLGETREGMKTVFTSGYANYSFSKYNVVDGGVPFIQKPYAAEGFIKKVREVLDRKP